MILFTTNDYKAIQLAAGIYPEIWYTRKNGRYEVRMRPKLNGGRQARFQFLAQIPPRTTH
jgi:hypothetical protein